MNRQLRWARGEEGTSLVLALAFITMFGVFAALLAQFGAESFKTTAAVRDRRAGVYAAEGAVDTAIDSVRGNASLGTNGGPCFSAVSPLSLGTVAGHAITATCTGQASAVGGVNAALPSQALLTTATGSEDGVTVALGTVKMDGGVFSNSDITVAAGVLDAGSSPVTARGTCNAYFAEIDGNPVTCNVGAGGHTEGNDPNYASPLSSVPTHQTVPSCPASGNKVITFNPGFYDDDDALNNLTYDTSSNDSCHNAVLWFKPGQYYFDFDWRSGDTSHTWLINDPTIHIVGGQAKNWNPANPTPPTIPPPPAPGTNAGGACMTESDGATAGVQFVFGADSNIAGLTGNIEVCATPDAAGRELAIYGQKTGAPPAPVTITMQPSLNGAGATNITGFPSPLSPANAVNAINDNQYTRASLNGNGKSASIKLSGYGASAVRTDAELQSVQIAISHRESLSASVNNVSATVSAADGKTCSINSSTFGSPLVEHQSTSTFFTDTWTPPCITSAADLQGLTLTYSAVLNGSGGPSSLIDFDGAAITVRYMNPALEAESGCVTIPSSQSGACDLIALSTNYTGSFFVNGTVYAPLARFTLELGGAFSGSTTRVGFTRGVVLRAVILLDGAFTPSVPPTFSIPDSGRTVTFIGNVDGTRRVRAVVNFVDNPTPGAQVDVTSWSVQG